MSDATGSSRESHRTTALQLAAAFAIAVLAIDIIQPVRSPTALVDVAPPSEALICSDQPSAPTSPNASCDWPTRTDAEAPKWLELARDGSALVSHDEPPICVE